MEWKSSANAARNPFEWFLRKPSEPLETTGAEGSVAASLWKSVLCTDASSLACIYILFVYSHLNQPPVRVLKSPSRTPILAWESILRARALRDSHETRKGDACSLSGAFPLWDLYFTFEDRDDWHTFDVRLPHLLGICSSPKGPKDPNMEYVGFPY